jgi:hypothetical protein
MNLSMKCMKLDYLLLKPYLKSMLLVLLVQLIQLIGDRLVVKSDKRRR